MTKKTRRFSLVVLSSSSSLRLHAQKTMAFSFSRSSSSSSSLVVLSLDVRVLPTLSSFSAVSLPRVDKNLPLLRISSVLSLEQLQQQQQQQQVVVPLQFALWKLLAWRHRFLRSKLVSTSLEKTKKPLFGCCFFRRRLRLNRHQLLPPTSLPSREKNSRRRPIQIARRDQFLSTALFF